MILYITYYNGKWIEDLNEMVKLGLVQVQGVQEKMNRFFSCCLQEWEIKLKLVKDSLFSGSGSRIRIQPEIRISDPDPDPDSLCLNSKLLEHLYVV